MEIIDDYESVIEVEAHTNYFLSQELSWYDRKDSNEFDWGYALTTHKAQGSQWDDVVVIDESSVFRQDKWKWLYTAVTRAAEKVCIVRRD
jgi:exodeoxyribonuclease-5